MRLGNVALGSVETGLITAGSAQLARYYGVPCRSVGGATESKLEDFQAGIERMATLLPAVLGGVDFITCAGTLDSTMMESDALLMLDDELCGLALRMLQGVRVTDESIALDLIQKVNYSGHYLAEPHTARTFRQEHYIPKLLPREPYDAWEKAGSRPALELARESARTILAEHQPRQIDPAVEKELDDFRAMVSQRTIEDFYAGEQEAAQDYGEPQGYTA
jgi:trimethylamine--corrinoid protein Co-methyltransferase